MPHLSAASVRPIAHAHHNVRFHAQNRLLECKQEAKHLRADLTFWLAYAAKNDIHSEHNVALAAARAHSLWKGQDAIVIFPGGREVAFSHGMRT